MAKSKSDRDNNGHVHKNRVFKNPNDLLDAWNEYKDYRKEEAKQWPKVQYVGRDGQRVEDYPVMPLDLKGFYAFYYNKYGKHIHQYFENFQGYYDEFLGICTHVENERDNSLRTGSLLGFYKENMAARITGDKDNQDLTSNGQPLQPEGVIHKLVIPKENNE